MRKAPAELPTVLIFATGGSIGMHDIGRGFEPDPAFLEVLEVRCNEIAEQFGFRARVNQLQPAIDSANADEGTAPKIARAVRARVTAMQPRGVVVIHGTDTLAYTASRLAFDLVDLGVPVVVTGSQLPHGETPTDAFDNIQLAIRTAMQASPSAPVSVAFGGRVLPAVRATKFDAIGLKAFRAERPLSTSPTGIPKIEGSVPNGAAGQTGVARAWHSRVISFKFTPATSARDLLAAVGGEPDALVLECYGPGSAPMSKPGMPDALREIVKRIPVVAISQSTLGGVNSERYAIGRQLASVGVIPGSDLTLEAVVAKLSYLLDRGFSREQISDLVAQNLIGECETVLAEA